ncbi:MarR family winged helix-turn-helix transcriptional regulator [Planctomonas psychrotolerans]|uniref:MarR family winged helix-turn-helix transcriptional regulator n=1 Tax=Planctomonas psychrotolerans TaxID=2528712 RepID=UPI001D0CF7CF|nr:MarR family transcriptional regulator [Planctomonas psychrotolerans]
MTATPDPDSASADHDDASALSRELRVAVMRVSRRLRAERANDEVSDAQFAVLGFLFRDGPLTPGALSELERVSPPSMNRTVNCLADAGLVTREAAPSDGRKVLVTLTEAGRNTVLETRRRRSAWLYARLAELSPADRSVLTDAAVLLQGIADS